jgi:thioredoxin 1
MKTRILLSLLAASSIIFTTSMNADITLTAGSLNHLEHYITNSGDVTAQFDQILQRYPNVVVDFYANWCGPCQRMLPSIERLAGEFNNVIFIKVNIETFKTLSNRYSVQSIPTLIFFKNGSSVSRTVGAKNKSELASRLSSIY